MSHQIVYELFLLVLLDRCASLIFAGLPGLSLTDQDVSSVYLLYWLTIFILGLAFVEFDDMKAVLGLHNLANLTRLQRKSSLLKLRDHRSGSKPAKVATFLFTARIG